MSTRRVCSRLSLLLGSSVLLLVRATPALHPFIRRRLRRRLHCSCCPHGATFRGFHLLPQQLNSDHGEAICLRRPSIPSAAPSAPPSFPSRRPLVALRICRLVSSSASPPAPSSLFVLSTRRDLPRLFFAASAAQFRSWRGHLPPPSVHSLGGALGAALKSRRRRAVAPCHAPSRTVTTVTHRHAGVAHGVRGRSDC
jgi:hypothetical protein